MRHIIVDSNLFLIEQEITKAKAQEIKTGDMNYIILQDRSGSMYCTLGQLIEDKIQALREIPIGSYVTLGWFSGTGQYNIVMKGFRVSHDSDYEKIAAVLRKNNTTLGMTCFSEIFTEVAQIVDDLKTLTSSNSFALEVLTDGCPTVGDPRREESSIFAALDKISGQMAASMFIGYGDYYNKDLMARMAAAVGGTAVHASDLKMAAVHVNNFREQVKNGAGTKERIQLELPVAASDIIFSINGKMVNSYQPDAKNGINYCYTKRIVDTVYILTSKKPPDASKEVKLTASESNDNEVRIKATLAAAMLSSQYMRNDVAQSLLGAVGDIKLINGITNAFTPADYGSVENAIMGAIFNPVTRFAAGRDTNYLPKEDALCTLEVLERLVDDDLAKFYPRHPDFQYNKIGKSEVTAEGYSKFEPFEKNPAAELSGLVWNEDRPNLSIRTEVKGEVVLLPRDGVSAKDVGLADKYPTMQYRTYTIVKDGNLNVQKLPISCSFNTFEFLMENNLIDGMSKYINEKQIYTVDLASLPLVNKKIARSKAITATELCSKAYEQTCLEAKLKALKYLNAQYEAKATSAAASTLSGKQDAFLAANGIKHGIYNPPSVSAESEDCYMAKCFEIKIAKLSSLPSVKEVIAKITEGKKLTVSASLVNDGLEMYNTATSKFKDDLKAAWLKSTIADLNLQLKKVRKVVQEIKFATLLGKQWFPEFTTRQEENKLTIQDTEFTIVVRDLRVNI